MRIPGKRYRMPRKRKKWVIKRFGRNDYRYLCARYQLQDKFNQQCIQAQRALLNLSEEIHKHAIPAMRSFVNAQAGLAEKMSAFLQKHVPVFNAHSVVTNKSFTITFQQ